MLEPCWRLGLRPFEDPCVTPCACLEKHDDWMDTKETSHRRGGWGGRDGAADRVDRGRPGRRRRRRQVLAANDLALWYDEPAGTDWLRALPIGNGRLGAMVFGNVDTERLQLNEDTVWAGGPYDSSNTRGAAALAEIRRLVFADQWTQAQDLINQTMLGNPVGQLAYQPVGNLRLAFGSASGASQYSRTLDLTTATVSDDVRAERRAVPARGVRQRTGPGDRRCG